MRNSERGQALIIAIVGVALVILTLLTALTITQFSGKLVYAQLLYQGQALNVAQAGLTEGLSWFRRQSSQPVTDFFPQRNTGAVPPIYDTEVQTSGLVRTFTVSNQGNLWGQYMLVRTKHAGDPGSYVTNNLDITKQKGKAGVGQVWQLESTGTIFVKNSSSSFDPTVSPNKILAKQTLRDEIMRISINRPGDAALSLPRSDCLTVSNTDAEVRGNGGGSVWWVNSPSASTPNGTGWTTPSSSGNISPAASTSSGIASTPNRFTVPYIFGMTDQELISAANITATSMATLPNPLPPMQIIVLNNPGTNFTFTTAQPLTGSGILVVFGNLIIQAGSLSDWNGFIFVRGSFTMSQPASINGAVAIDAGASASGRNVVISGSTEKADLRFDPTLLSFIEQRLGVYNVTRASYVPCPATGPCL